MSQNSRLGIVTRDELEGDHLRFYDELSALAEAYFGDSFTYKLPSDAFIGPFGLMIHTPTLGRPFFALATALGALGALPNLPPKAREVAILAIGAYYASAYELYAHAGVGAKAGLTEQEIEELRAGRKPGSLDVEGGVAWDVARELVGGRGPLGEEVWARAVRVLGREGAGALVHYVGYYAYTSLMLNGFNVRVPGEREVGEVDGGV